MAQMAPPHYPTAVTLDDHDGFRRLRFQLWLVWLTVLTVVATAWLCTFGWVAGILAVCVAKHVLVAILLMGLQVNRPRPREE